MLLKATLTLLIASSSFVNALTHESVSQNLVNELIQTSSTSTSEAVVIITKNYTSPFPPVGIQTYTTDFIHYADITSLNV